MNSSLPAVTITPSGSFLDLNWPWSASGYHAVSHLECQDLAARCAAELGEDAPDAACGSLEAYAAYRALMGRLARREQETGAACRAALTPALEGLEGARVEAVRLTGETVRFQVGRSRGPAPRHLELASRASGAGRPADREYRSVRVVRPA